MKQGVRSDINAGIYELLIGRKAWLEDGLWVCEEGIASPAACSAWDGEVVGHLVRNGRYRDGAAKVQIPDYIGGIEAAILLKGFCSGKGTQTLQVLRGAPRRGVYVFCSPRAPERPLRGYRKAFKRACALVGVVAARPHDLRRTAASIMTSMGVSRIVVGHILNHAARGVTAVYERCATSAPATQPTLGFSFLRRRGTLYSFSIAGAHA